MPAGAEEVAACRREFGVPEDSPLVGFVGRLHEQKGITVTHQQIEGAGHFFETEDYMDTMVGNVTDYVKRRLTETTR